MSRTCIICGAPANSSEHIFPAALGGRRTNNGIYCKTHNNELGLLAREIAKQLKPINALLSVTGAHARQAMPYNYTSPEGETLIIFNGNVRRQAHQPGGSDKPMHVQLTLGGPEGLRSVAYVALTYFAHFFPQQARTVAVKGIKDFVLGKCENDYVWWENVEIISHFPQSSFEFCHTVALTTLPSGETQAIICFFGSLVFAVRIGQIADTTLGTIVVHVNPLAKGRPDDVKELKQNIVLFYSEKPDPLHAHLTRIVHHGLGQKWFQRLLERIELWKFNNELVVAMNFLNNKRRSGLLTHDHIRQFVEGEIGRVYRLMEFVADNFASEYDDKRLYHAIKHSLDTCIALDPSSDSGLSPVAYHMLSLAAEAIVSALADELKQRDIDIMFLWSLLSSGKGAGVVGEIMFATILQSLTLPDQD